MTKTIDFSEFGAEMLRDLTPQDVLHVSNVPPTRVPSVQSQLSRWRRMNAQFNYKSNSAKIEDSENYEISIFVL